MAGVLGSCVDSLTTWSRALDLREKLPLDCDRHSELLLIFSVFFQFKKYFEPCPASTFGLKSKAASRSSGLGRQCWLWLLVRCEPGVLPLSWRQRRRTASLRVASNTLFRPVVFSSVKLLSFENSASRPLTGVDLDPHPQP